MSTHTYTRHALVKMIENGWTLEDVAACVDAPSITYVNSREGSMRYIRNGLCVILEVATRTVITVHLSTVETAIRPDQMNDAAAVEYERKRKRNGK